MRTFGSFLAVGILALTVGCGGSSSTGYTSPTGRTVSSGGSVCKNQSCAAQDSYYSCLAGKCDAQAKTCFGASYASGTFAGACQALITCTMACPCDDTGPLCLAACYGNITADCETCVGTITTCESTASCVPATCTNDSGTATNDSGTATKNDSGTATGSGCAAAQACCTALGTSLGASAAQQCSAALTGLTDAECSQAHPFQGHREGRFPPLRMRAVET